MSVLDDQLKRLKAGLESRERWALSLQRHIAEVQGELAVHEAIIELGRDSSILRVIEELYDQPRLGEEIARDPRAFFSRRGISLPEEATVTVVNGPPSPAIELRVRSAPVEYGVGWSRRDGFYILSLQPAVGVEAEEQ